VITAGESVPNSVHSRTVVFDGPPAVLDSQYYSWWTQFSDKPQSVIWKPAS
jgi:hypothetical protein